MEKCQINDSVGLLIPNDKLHVYSVENVEKVANEFFSVERKKPLIVFFDSFNKGNNLAKETIKKVAEQQFGFCKVKDILLKKGEEKNFENDIPEIGELPYNVVGVEFDEIDIDKGMLLMGKLARNINQHIVVYIKATNQIYKDTVTYDTDTMRWVYCDRAAEIFSTWYSRAYFMVADNCENHYRQRRLVYLASSNISMFNWIHYMGNEDNRKLYELLSDPVRFGEEYGQFINQMVKANKIEQVFNMMYFDDQPIVERENTSRWNINLPVDEKFINTIEKEVGKDVELRTWVEVCGDIVLTYQGLPMDLNL